MTGIQVFQNTAGNIRPSEIARDMKLSPNGEFFLQKDRVVGDMFGKGTGLMAIDPDVGLKIPMYLKKIPVITGFQPVQR